MIGAHKAIAIITVTAASTHLIVMSSIIRIK